MSRAAYIDKLAGLRSLMSVMDDIPFLYHRIFAAREKDEQQVAIQPHIRGMNIPISVPLMNKMSELLMPENAFRQSKAEVVAIPKKTTTKVFKGNAASNQPVSRQMMPMENDVKTSAAGNYEYQGQEVIEAKSYKDGGTQYDATSVQKLDAQRQLALQHARMPHNIVEVFRQHLATRKNNDQQWDKNGNKVG